MEVRDIQQNWNAEHLVMERHYLFLWVIVLRPRMLRVPRLVEHKKNRVTYQIIVVGSRGEIMWDWNKLRVDIQMDLTGIGCKSVNWNEDWIQDLLWMGRKCFLYKNEFLDHDNSFPVKKFHALYGNWKFITVSTTARHKSTCI